jgi:hypothetical protein
MSYDLLAYKIHEGKRAWNISKREVSGKRGITVGSPSQVRGILKTKVGRTLVELPVIYR